MALFGIGKKNEDEKRVPACCSDAPTEAASGGCCGHAPKDIASIKVLGAGCKSCHEQYENTKAAIAAMGLHVEVAYVTDLKQIMAYGVMSMPAIVVNETVVSAGKVLKAADVEKLLHKLGF